MKRRDWYEKRTWDDDCFTYWRLGPLRITRRRGCWTHQQRPVFQTAWAAVIGKLEVSWNSPV